MSHRVIASVFLVMSAGMLLTTAAAAQSESEVIFPGDAHMSCLAIVEEININSEILGGAPETGVLGSPQAVNAVTNLAMQTAYNQGANQLAEGLGIAGALFGAARRRAQERERAQQAIAQNRWYYLNGLYTGADCDNRIQDEMAARFAQEAEAGTQ